MITVLTGWEISKFFLDTFRLRKQKIGLAFYGYLPLTTIKGFVIYFCNTDYENNGFYFVVLIFLEVFDVLENQRHIYNDL